MSAHPALHPAIVRAQSEENVASGGEFVRHRLSSRIIHWSVALSFGVALLSGLPIWTPVFSWTAALFGGLAVCRVVHPWAGSAFVLASLVMFVHWLADMILLPGEGNWLGPKALSYMRHEASDDSEVGKYNGGQKLFFFAAALGALGFLASGLVLWFPANFGVDLREAAILLHDFTFILFGVAIVGHIYLGTAAEPGTFQSMTRGTVSAAWARLHHPRWYREMTGGGPR